MALFVAKNGSLQTIKGIYYGMTEDYINATLFHNLVPETATEIRFLYASDNPDLTGYQKLGYCDNNNFIEVWNNGTIYIIINPRKNYIYAPISCYEFLRNYTALTDCVFDNFDTRNVTNMGYMFFYCQNLTNLDLSSFDTQNVTSMYSFVSLCRSLISIDIRNFNTSKVTTFSYMFISCSKLHTIISNTFSKLSLKDSSWMFQGCLILVGGAGTAYSSSHINAEYARVDGENGLPGYFTAPNN